MATELFGTDGVRGRAGLMINAMTCMRLAMATGIYFRPYAKTNKILVGKDTRRSGYMIENAIVSGLTAIGYDVIQIGPMPTPAIAFLTENMRCDAGIMISASHNPYYDNGVKFFDSKGNKLNRETESKIESIYNDIEAIEKAQATDNKIGKSKRIDDVVGRYIVQTKNSFPKHITLTNMRIVVDCANGAGYKVAPAVLDELGADVRIISNKPNGFNINKDCGAMHPEALSSAVREYKADIGIALDGDADRVILVDENGDIIDGDKLIGVLAVYLKGNNILKGDGIVTTVMSNKGLEEYLENHGLKLYRSAVGDKHVISMMQELGINFGGEQSGHIIFSDYAKTGDGISSALQALAYLVSIGQKASEAFNPYRSYPQKLISIPIEKKIHIDDIDGINDLKSRIKNDKMRYLFRYSGTENVIRIQLEGNDADKLDSTMHRCIDFFKGALL